MQILKWKHITFKLLIPFLVLNVVFSHKRRRELMGNVRCRHSPLTWRFVHWHPKYDRMSKLLSYICLGKSNKSEMHTAVLLLS